MRPSLFNLTLKRFMFRIFRCFVISGYPIGKKNPGNWTGKSVQTEIRELCTSRLRIGRIEIF